METAPSHQWSRGWGRAGGSNLNVLSVVLRWIGSNALALGALAVSIFALVRTYVKDARKLMVRAGWEWSTNPEDAQPSRAITVYCVNKRQRQVKVANVAYDLERDDRESKPWESWGAIDDSTKQNQTLADGEFLNAVFKTTQYEEIVSVYAIDSVGKKWHVPGWQIESIRERKAPKKPVKLTRVRRLGLQIRYWRLRRVLGIPKRALT